MDSWFALVRNPRFALETSIVGSDPVRSCQILSDPHMFKVQRTQIFAAENPEFLLVKSPKKSLVNCTFWLPVSNLPIWDALSAGVI